MAVAMVAVVMVAVGGNSDGGGSDGGSSDGGNNDGNGDGGNNDGGVAACFPGARCSRQSKWSGCCAAAAAAAAAPSSDLGEASEMGEIPVLVKAAKRPVGGRNTL